MNSYVNVLMTIVILYLLMSLYRREERFQVVNTTSSLIVEDSHNLKVEKIVDFTTLVKDKKQYTVFNPCITHYMNDLYLCCVRVITKNINLETDYPNEFPEIDRSIYGNPNHPWRFKWNRDDKEKGKPYLEFTKFAMLKINKSPKIGYDIELVKSYNEMLNDFSNEVVLNSFRLYDLNNDLKSYANQSLPNFFQRMIDTRIHKTPVNNLFFLTGNMFLTDDNDSIRKNQKELRPPEKNCENGCFIIFIMSFEINPVTLKITYLNKPVPLCRYYAGTIEKNWSLIIKPPKNSQLEFIITYQLASSINAGHEMLGSFYDLPSNTFNSNCGQLNVVNKGLSFYEVIEDAYKPYLFISSTTPTIVFNENELIAVGHVKYKYNDFLDPKSNLPLAKFTLDLQAKVRNFHYDYVYLFFFYTLDNNLNIKRTSLFFLPQPADVALIFPTGLTRVGNNDFCMSYGDYDTNCTAMFITYDDLNNSLIEINSTNFPFFDSSLDEDVMHRLAREFNFFKYTDWKTTLNKVIIK